MEAEVVGCPVRFRMVAVAVDGMKGIPTDSAVVASRKVAPKIKHTTPKMNFGVVRGIGR
jgi:hypothetical protein